MTKSTIKFFFGTHEHLNIGTGAAMALLIFLNQKIFTYLKALLYIKKKEALLSQKIK